MNSALPLLKVVIESKESLAGKFKGKNALVQVSARSPEGKAAAHFVINDGIWTVGRGTVDKPHVELEFKSIPELNDFFAGRSKKLPRIKGWLHTGLLIGTFSALLSMSKLLGSKEPPKDAADRELLVRLYFYLLSSGISQLNKAGHPEVSKWARKSPDRIYAWAVDGKPDVSAYLRVKGGRTKSVRGQYTRSKPFFTMRFDSIDSALGILLQTDNLIEAAIKGRLIMDGAPEFGAEIGEFMNLVGTYAK